MQATMRKNFLIWKRLRRCNVCTSKNLLSIRLLDGTEARLVPGYVSGFKLMWIEKTEAFQRGLGFQSLHFVNAICLFCGLFSSPPPQRLIVQIRSSFFSLTRLYSQNLHGFRVRTPCMSLNPFSSICCGSLWKPHFYLSFAFIQGTLIRFVKGSCSCPMVSNFSNSMYLDMTLLMVAYTCLAVLIVHWFLLQLPCFCLWSPTFTSITCSIWTHCVLAHHFSVTHSKDYVL
jgi:hypothetical protein